MEEKNKEVEIDLLELARKLWDNKKFIIKVTIIGAIIGLIIAFSIPKEYTTTVVFTTNSNDAKAGNMGALASLAGINLGGSQSSDVFSPELYPSVINSTPFIQGLLTIRIQDLNQGIDTTVFSYLKDEQKKAWWTYVLGIPRSLLNVLKTDKKNSNKRIENPFFISNEEMEAIEALKNTFIINTDKKTGITSLEVVSQSPVISAFLADTLTSYLQAYIIKERTKKAKTDLYNTTQLYEQSRRAYDSIQQKHAVFVDANQNIALAKYKIKQDKLESEKDLAYSLYTQMAQQLQMASLKVQDETPVFTIIQPAIEPLFPSSPKKKMIFAVFIFLSFVVACAWLSGSEYVKQLTKNKQ